MHGLEDLDLKLHRLSVEGRWREMAQHITDDTLRLTACGTYKEIASEIQKRFGGAADTIEIFLPSNFELEPVREVVADIRRIPQVFQSFRTEW